MAIERGVWWDVLKQTGKGYAAHKIPQLAAAIAFYTILSASPLLIIVLGIAGLFFSKQAVEGEVLGQLRNLVGEDGGKAIQAIIANARHLEANVMAMAAGFVMLLIGASGVFTEMQASLNTIWEVPSQAGVGVRAFFKDRLLSFVMVLGTGFILLATLVISSVFSVLINMVGLAGVGFVGHLLNFGTSLVVITLLFAMIFKVLPNASITWRDVWIGAGATAFLFMVGELLIGLYLGRASIGTAYGAAGSLVVFVVWIYYSGQILLLGAEFTRAYTTKRGSHQKLAGETADRTGFRVEADSLKH